MRANSLPSAVMVLAMVVASHSVRANPNGAAIVSGAALLSNPAAGVLQVVNTPGAIVNWNTFSIGAGETTRFVQINAQSAVLNRVLGANPSNILGTLQSNGRVFLINPNGIVFGAASVVDVAGLIAATRDIADADFLGGNYRFTGNGGGAITLQSGARIATVNAGIGGQVWLFAKNVTQEAGSSIAAPQGQVVLAAGTELAVAQSNLGNMVFNLTTDGSNTIQTLGAIAAERGAVGLFADAITHGGTVNAGTGGVVAMNATTDLTFKDGSSTTAPNGSITLRGGSRLEVEFAAGITADGASGNISFESNNLLVYPSGNTHAIDGQVSFNQYQPSTYSLALSEVVIPSSALGHSRGQSPAIVYRRADGSYAVRDASAPVIFEQTTWTIWETILDASGRVVSASTVIGTVVAPSGWYSDPTAYAAMLQGVPALYWDRYVGAVAGTAARMKLADGGTVQLVFDESSRIVKARLSASNGSFVADVVVPPYGASFAIPTTDGRVVIGAGGILPLEIYSADGTKIAEQAPRLTSLGPGYPMPDGAITYINNLDTVGYVAERWNKTVPAYTPTNSISSTAGTVPALASAPGVALDPAVTATPPPTPEPTPPAEPPVPVVHGDPSTGPRNIDFTLSGCNASVCSDDYRASIAALNAARAANRAGQNPMDDQLNAAAVLALAELAGRPGIISVDGALATATLMRDDDSLRQLVIGYGNFAQMTPAMRLAVFEQWKNIYANAQSAGQATAITVADVANNIVTEDEQRAFMNAIASYQREFSQ